MKKTIKDWLSEIKDPEVREKALRNADIDFFDGTAMTKTLHEVLKGSFIWSATPEGYDYWLEQYNKFKEDLKPIPYSTLDGE